MAAIEEGNDTGGEEKLESAAVSEAASKNMNNPESMKKKEKLQKQLMHESQTYY